MKQWTYYLLIVALTFVGLSSLAPARALADEPVQFSLLNTKSEIQSQFEQMAQAYSEAKGVDFEVYVTVGDSPSEDITKRHASGEVPTLFMGDVQDIIMLAEYARDLSDQAWMKDGGESFSIQLDGKTLDFPFCVEARGLIYNQTVIEDLTGEDFDPKGISSYEDFEALLDKLVDAGMETPVALNMEDWSLAGHYLTMIYEAEGDQPESVQEFIDQLYAGDVSLMDDTVFNTYMDTFDLLAEHNINSKDPLAADYDMNALYLAEGDVAFWFNGNWAWAELSDFALDDASYGIMPVPVKEDAIGANQKLFGGPSKRVMVDTRYNSEEQQEAALDFLNWLVYDEEGQDFLVNQCDLVPSFSNIELEVTNPLGLSVQEYASEDQLVPNYPELPGDHWKTMGAEMQKYLAGETDRAGFASAIEDYWASK